MNGFRIGLPDRLFPLQAFLNIWPDSEYLPMLRRTSAGIESVSNGVGWSWWKGEDECPPAKGQLLFYVAQDEVSLSVAEALNHFRTATENWLMQQPSLREEAHGLLMGIERLFSE
ncbi:MAG: hypothetical protein WC729_05320 [Sphingomonas sp.]|jgi:hypothetical protein|uniref:hypothetical protein n=1 Tax=Sphingomonas sp. TaxID=28214 RepID=UPI00356B3264